MAIYFHVWFSTKRRVAALQGEIAEEVHRLIREAAVRAGIDIVEMSLPIDHVHLMLRLKDGQSVSWAVNRLKGASARLLFKLMPELKLDMRGDHLWQRGYGHRLVPIDQIATVRNYIATQFDRPLGHEQ